MENNDQFPAVPPPSAPKELNFADLYSKAMAMPDEPTPEVPSAPAVPSDPGLPSIADVAAKLEASPEAVEQPKVEAAAEPREFRDDDLVKVKIDGKEEVVSYKDYKDGIQREAVFTKRMQTLAQQREQAEQELATKYAQLYQYAQAVQMAKQELETNNPLAKLAHQLEQKQQVEKDPNTLATIGEIKSALQEHKQALEQDLAAREQAQQQRLVQATQTLRQQAAQQQDAARFTAALQETLSNKDLAVVKSAVPSPELADAIIRYNVAKMGPETIEEGIEYMKTYVKQWADQVKSQSTQDRGRAEAVRARAVIETPNGSPPTPSQANRPQQFFKKDGGLDWSSLHERAKAMLET